MSLDLSDVAQADWDSGLVDGRLVKLLVRLAHEYEVRVRLIKTGHPMGPRSPAGRENDHFFCRAADIDAVNGLPVEAAPASPALVAVGHLLMGLTSPLRPARVMGPADWHTALGEGDRSGFRTDTFANDVHHDHLHVGY